MEAHYRQKQDAEECFHAFTIGSNYPVTFARNWHWRIDRMTGPGGESYRLLTAFNGNIEEYRAWFTLETGSSATLLARLELHGSHPGWHCHAPCDDVFANDLGALRTRGCTRFPSSGRFHRRLEFDITTRADAFILVLSDWHTVRRFPVKEALCKAFCDDIQVRRVPAGLAVSTGFVGSDGDKIGFYIVESEHVPLKRIEESGTTFATLEASGVDFRSETRRDALSQLLEEHSVSFDDNIFYIDRLRELDVPGAALRFVSFSLRIRDFLLMTEYRVASTFREDAERELRKVVGDKARIEEGEAIAPALADSPADFVLRTNNRPPVGVYLCTSDNRVYEAMLVNMRAVHEVKIRCSIAVLVERLPVVSSRVRASDESLGGFCGIQGR